jgi:Flp pilus assembly protein TadG
MKRIMLRRYGRRGTTVVETAVMAPLLVTAMLGMFEVGYAFMVKQTVTLAAREGARAAALPGGNMEDVNTAVDSTMATARLSGYSTTSNISQCGPTDVETWVEVSIPFSRASFTGGLLGGGSFNITAKTTMRREGLDNTGGQGVDPP